MPTDLVSGKISLPYLQMPLCLYMTFPLSEQREETERERESDEQKEEEKERRGRE